MKNILILLSMILATSANADDGARFASIFTNNLVLQQKSTVNIWGYAKPNEPISVICSWNGSINKVLANATGYWVTAIKTPKASFTPHTITLNDSKSNTVILNNVLIGEVWLCSGQSNMEMVLQSFREWNLIVENSEAEIAKANYPNIRMVTIDRKESFTLVDEINPKGGWKVCTPNNAKWFSAVAYFFGKELFNKLNVPIGLVVTAYGGSPIQSWIPLEVMENSPIYSDRIAQRKLEIDASAQTEGEYIEAMKKWINESEKTAVETANNNQDITLQLPINFEKSHVGNQMGEIRLSKTISIANNEKDRDLYISLGTMDDLGRVYFNGELVWEELRNSHSYSQIDFTVPASKVKPGNNVIEAHILNILWGGGLTGPADKMFYTIGNNPEKQTLTGVWNYQKVFDLFAAKPIPREGKPQYSNASALYNGMLYPLINFKFKGCIWYQGEENVSEYDRYTQMFTDMITAWRTKFQTNLPFYYVQIAPYCYNGHLPLNAVKQREAQSKIEVTIPNTAMVVTMDVGEENNIHPARKQEVGLRLAQTALASSYGVKVASKYPKPQKASVKDGVLTLSFSNTYKGLVAKGTEHDFEISEDGNTYYQANVTITGNQINLSNAQVKNPRHARYCWHDAAKGTIFNSANLPVASFRISVPK